MIKQVSHTVADPDPASLALALEVAYELHAPVTSRAPELATGRPTARSRTRRRTTARA
ncbi:hypothetical protein [Streptomyces sp. TRM68416]|uniref:hypothetical protein n=1 Tax=Streptomyces sp. TRM68416 TaxID=2758412 RepID=UPI001661ABDA|nr:hypothetical protein [Streptomyces sp. TRM68416]MBD0840418.1 hypothetical protein [Streptomyces sp. TRM68416]